MESKQARVTKAEMELTAHRQAAAFAELAGQFSEFREMSRTIAVQLTKCQLELAEARKNGERLEFVISAMNCWDMFDRFLEEYHPTKRSSRQRTDSAEWLAAIDAAMEMK